MRLTHLLPLAGLLAIFATRGLSQAPDPSPAAPNPETPAPLSRPAQGTSPAVPIPGRAGDVPALPPYAGAPAQGQTVPAPTPAPPPVVAPGTPTSQAPYGALPAYNSAASTGQAQPPYDPYAMTSQRRKPHDGSPYIPVDNWIYPEMTRLYSLGYVNTMFLSMRPWTRQSVLHMLDESETEIRNGDSDEAREILAVIERELREEMPDGSGSRGTVYGTESVYTRVMGITGTSLRDSYYIGQTLANDYGRPYQPGFNNVTGFSTLAESGRFSFYFRGEYQHSPSAAGYSPALSSMFSYNDGIPYTGYNLHQPTIPSGPIGAQNPFRILEATVSFHGLGHELSFGKSDAWLGPAQGGALAWSNNAENIYSARIDRVEPLYIPLLSRILGPLRYEFYYGSLKGHTDPNSPYIHSEMFAFRPTRNFEFGFQRSVIFGGKAHEPVTLHNFLRSFFSINDTSLAQKNSASDPGARFTDFNMSYRLPFIRRYATLYVDSFAHDDVTPPSAPRRAAFRTGLYLSQIKGIPKLDLRAEAALTNTDNGRTQHGSFYYYEGIQAQGYTNKGFLLGDWIGREGAGGQAWLTYHLSGNESVQIEYTNKKNANDFIVNGTTQNDFKASIIKRFHHDDVELNAWFQYERWKAPVYLPGAQSDSVTAVQITFFPGLKTRANK